MCSVEFSKVYMSMIVFCLFGKLASMWVHVYIHFVFFNLSFASQRVVLFVPLGFGIFRLFVFWNPFCAFFELARLSLY